MIGDGVCKSISLKIQAPARAVRVRCEDGVEWMSFTPARGCGEWGVERDEVRSLACPGHGSCILRV